MAKIRGERTQPRLHCFFRGESHASSHLTSQVPPLFPDSGYATAPTGPTDLRHGFRVSLNKGFS